LSTVLVSGGSVFIGSHCIVQLLLAGLQVRTTVRDLKRERAVRTMLQEAAPCRTIACLSSPPISKAIRGGQKPSPAANTFATWHHSSH
jgi:hypothetical protein